MDISVKKIQIERLGGDGLVCKDNMRADIKVAFFVRVNNEVEFIKKVAQTIGCQRASDKGTLEDLFYRVEYFLKHLLIHKIYFDPFYQSSTTIYILYLLVQY